MKEKLRSWALWVSMAALVVFCVKEFGGVDISASVNGLLNVLCPVLVGFGIVNNPNSRDSL
ncbi:MAG: hypothetical protein E7549_00395 [Ruminococcaceae bacterium]|nr:hypothetical protein [Oscillospiraceae bacterium]